MACSRTRLQCATFCANSSPNSPLEPTQRALWVGVNAFEGAGGLPRPVVKTCLVVPAPDLVRHEAQLPEVRAVVESPELHPAARRRAICDVEAHVAVWIGVRGGVHDRRLKTASLLNRVGVRRNESRARQCGQTQDIGGTHALQDSAALPPSSRFLTVPLCRSSPPGLIFSRFNVTRAGGPPVRLGHPFLRFLALPSRPSYELRPYLAAGPARRVNECTVESVRRERGRIPCAD